MERVDFNSDNAKIDGALHALAEQVQPLVRAVPPVSYTHLSRQIYRAADAQHPRPCIFRIPFFQLQMFQDETGELEGAAARLEWNHIP